MIKIFGFILGYSSAQFIIFVCWFFGVWGDYRSQVLGSLLLIIGPLVGYFIAAECGGKNGS